MDDKNPSLGPFLGMNNRLPDQALHVDKKGDFVRSAVNVDFIAERVRSRPGYSQVQPGGAAVQSLWGDSGAFGYYVDGATLYRVRTGPGGLSRQSLRTDLSAGLRVSYDRNEGGEVFYSNGVQRGRDTGSVHATDWGTHPASGPSEHSRSMPSAMIVRFYRNRLLGARGPTLYVSEPWKFNLYNALDGIIPFLADLTMVAPLEAGVFIATLAAVYWLPDDIVSDGRVQQVLPYGVLPGSDRLLPNRKSVLWMTARGLVRGDNDGTVANLQEEALATSGGDAAATLYREYDGARRAVSAISNSVANVTEARSFMDAEVIRRGIAL